MNEYLSLLSMSQKTQVDASAGGIRNCRLTEPVGMRDSQKTIGNSRRVERVGSWQDQQINVELTRNVVGLLLHKVTTRFRPQEDCCGCDVMQCEARFETDKDWVTLFEDDIED
jgi:hypothetical protein